MNDFSDKRMPTSSLAVRRSGRDLELAPVVRVRVEKAIQFREPTADELAQVNRGFKLIFLLIFAVCLAGVFFFYMLVTLAFL